MYVADDDDDDQADLEEEFQIKKKGGDLWQTDNQESLGHEEDLLMRALKYVHSHVLCFSKAA